MPFLLEFGDSVVLLSTEVFLAYFFGVRLQNPLPIKISYIYFSNSRPIVTNQVSINFFNTIQVTNPLACFSDNKFFKNQNATQQFFTLANYENNETTGSTLEIFLFWTPHHFFQFYGPWTKFEIGENSPCSNSSPGRSPLWRGFLKCTQSQSAVWGP